MASSLATQRAALGSPKAAISQSNRQTNNHTLMLAPDGRVWTWGDILSRATGSPVGDGSKTNRFSPSSALLPVSCGNGFLESGEQCDDANTAGGRWLLAHLRHRGRQ